MNNQNQLNRINKLLNRAKTNQNTAVASLERSSLPHFTIHSTLEVTKQTIDSVNLMIERNQQDEKFQYICSELIMTITLLEVMQKQFPTNSNIIGVDLLNTTSQSI